MTDAPPKLSFSLTIASIALAVAGWGSLIYLITQTLPLVYNLWLFFAAWLIALTGTAIPFAHYLNKRFARTMPRDSVILRQAIWVGLFGGTCAWLELGDALNWASGALLAAALAAIEGFLILRDRSKRPFDDSAPTAKR